jgi:hypothetical protein
MRMGMPIRRAYQRFGLSAGSSRVRSPYRLFIWLLPFALVAVAGLGLAADAESESPQDAAESLGLEGLVSNSIANAAVIVPHERAVHPTRRV